MFLYKAALTEIVTSQIYCSLVRVSYIMGCIAGAQPIFHIYNRLNCYDKLLWDWGAVRILFSFIKIISIKQVFVFMVLTIFYKMSGNNLNIIDWAHCNVRQIAEGIGLYCLPTYCLISKKGLLYLINFLIYFRANDCDHSSDTSIFRYDWNLNKYLFRLFSWGFSVDPDYLKVFYFTVS